MWNNKRVLVTGGCSFIGSHLVDALVKRGAKVSVVDNLSSGKRENIVHQLPYIRFYDADLHEARNLGAFVDGTDVVFHLAAAHGGRGYVDTHQTECAFNMHLDQQLFHACYKAGAKVVFASSACVYPVSRLNNPYEQLYLTEDMAGAPYEPDNMYGFGKLASELTLKAMYRELGLRSAVVRYFHVYGPRSVENHALVAMIARCFIRQDPFVVWGTGEQIRNWTHVRDTVEGTILAAERIADATPINLCTQDRTRVIDAVKAVMKATGHDADIELHPEMPTGPYNRVGSYALAEKLLGWRPLVSFEDGLRETVEWYLATKNKADIATHLEGMLSER